MTTGRINQVTIFPGRPSAPKGEKATPVTLNEEVSELVIRSERGPKPSTQFEPPPGPEPPKVPTSYPIAPTELPKGWSAAALGIRDP